MKSASNLASPIAAVLALSLCAGAAHSSSTSADDITATVLALAAHYEPPAIFSDCCSLNGELALYLHRAGDDALARRVLLHSKIQIPLAFCDSDNGGTADLHDLLGVIVQASALLAIGEDDLGLEVLRQVDECVRQRQDRLQPLSDLPSAEGTTGYLFFLRRLTDQIADYQLTERTLTHLPSLRSALLGTSKIAPPRDDIRSAWQARWPTDANRHSTSLFDSHFRDAPYDTNAIATWCQNIANDSGQFPADVLLALVVYACDQASSVGLIAEACTLATYCAALPLSSPQVRTLRFQSYSVRKLIDVRRTSRESPIDGYSPDYSIDLYGFDDMLREVRTCQYRPSPRLLFLAMPDTSMHSSARKVLCAGLANALGCSVQTDSTIAFLRVRCETGSARGKLTANAIMSLHESFNSDYASAQSYCRAAGLYADALKNVISQELYLELQEGLMLVATACYDKAAAVQHGKNTLNWFREEANLFYIASAFARGGRINDAISVVADMCTDEGRFVALLRVADTLCQSKVLNNQSVGPILLRLRNEAGQATKACHD